MLFSHVVIVYKKFSIILCVEHKCEKNMFLGSANLEMSQERSVSVTNNWDIFIVFLIL
jgi:hypothetical protein